MLFFIVLAVFNIINIVVGAIELYYCTIVLREHKKVLREYEQKQL